MIQKKKKFFKHQTEALTSALEVQKQQQEVLKEQNKEIMMNYTSDIEKLKITHENNIQQLSTENLMQIEQRKKINKRMKKEDLWYYLNKFINKIGDLLSS